MMTGRLALARGDQFGLGGGAAARLADQHVDGVTLQQMLLLGEAEGSASEKHLVKPEGKRFGGCMDQSYQKAHFGDMREGIELAGADGEPGAAADFADQRGGGGEIGDLDPAVERMAFATSAAPP